MSEESLQQASGPDAPGPVRCFRHEGEDCPRCDGSGYRERKRCAGCGEPAGKPSEGGKVLSPARSARSVEEARSLPLFCSSCNPRTVGVGLAVLERMGG